MLRGGGVNLNPLCILGLRTAADLICLLNGRYIVFSVYMSSLRILQCFDITAFVGFQIISLFHHTNYHTRMQMRIVGTKMPNLSHLNQKKSITWLQTGCGIIGMMQIKDGVKKVIGQI